NGRVYDPTLGRFLSADPTMQSPYSSQGFNRYSYVHNNPLKYTDPSGYWSSGGVSGDSWAGDGWSDAGSADWSSYGGGTGDEYAGGDAEGLAYMDFAQANGIYTNGGWNHNAGNASLTDAYLSTHFSSYGLGQRATQRISNAISANERTFKQAQLAYFSVLQHGGILGSLGNISSNMVHLAIAGPLNKTGFTPGSYIYNGIQSRSGKFTMVSDLEMDYIIATSQRVSAWYDAIKRVTLGGTALPFLNTAIVVYDRATGFFPTNRVKAELTTTMLGAGTSVSFDTGYQAIGVHPNDEIGVQLGQSRYLSFGTNNALNSFDVNFPGVGIALPGIGFSKVIQEALPR
ncbi:MAG: RHS repeat-associated core domain-containing protein, partial [Candidatus Sedimenticola sp. (ex Thyasira tokunagai)]